MTFRPSASASNRAGLRAYEVDMCVGGYPAVMPPIVDMLQPQL